MTFHAFLASLPEQPGPRQEAIDRLVSLDIKTERAWEVFLLRNPLPPNATLDEQAAYRMATDRVRDLFDSYYTALRKRSIPFYRESEVRNVLAVAHKHDWPRIRDDWWILRESHVPYQRVKWILKDTLRALEARESGKGDDDVYRFAMEG